MSSKKTRQAKATTAVITHDKVIQIRKEKAALKKALAERSLAKANAEVQAHKLKLLELGYEPEDDEFDDPEDEESIEEQDPSPSVPSDTSNYTAILKEIDDRYSHAKGRYNFYFNWLSSHPNDPSTPEAESRRNQYAANFATAAKEREDFLELMEAHKPVTEEVAAPTAPVSAAPVPSAAKGKGNPQVTRAATPPPPKKPQDWSGKFIPLIYHPLLLPPIELP